MPSARPFISFLFGNIQHQNGSRSTATSATASSTTANSVVSSTAAAHSHSMFSQHAQSLRTSSTSPDCADSTRPEYPPPVTQPVAIRGGGHGYHHHHHHHHASANNNTTASQYNPAYLGNNKLAVSPIPSPGSPTANFPPYERRNSVGSDHNKWWIGGKAADGTEKYYRLQASQALSSHRSFDRLSLDRLSI